MEFRKLISFGKTSFVMSLPKSWVLKNKLKKGDLLGLEEIEEGLIVSTNKKTGENIQKEKIIDTSHKEINRIKREIVSAYINSYNPIIVTGKDLTAKAQEIRTALSSLIALEVMEQSSDKIIAKDFLNMEKISIMASVKKMDMITRSMLTDSKSIKDVHDYKSIYHRDEDINRLSFMVYRAIKYALDNPEMTRIYNIPTYELIHLWFVVTNIEKIADNAKRVAKNFYELRSDTKILNKLLSLYDVMEKRYLKTMKSFYNKEATTSYEIANTKREVMLEFREYAMKNKGNWLVCDTIDKMQQILADTHDITRTTYLFL